MTFSSLVRAGISAGIFLTITTGAIAQTQPSEAENPTVATIDQVAVTKTDKTKTSDLDKFSTDKTKKVKLPADAAVAPEAKSAQSTSDRKWQFAFAPYLYLTALSGTVGANGRTAEIDQSIGDVLSHFKAGFMGAFEARRGRFILFNDLIWTKLTEESDTPGALYNTGKVSVNMTVINPDAGVRVVDKKGGSFDVFGGVRITSVKNILSFTSGILPGFSTEARKTWAAPVVGGRGVANLSEKVFLSTIFDVGGGFDTHVTGQFYGGMGYKIKPKIAMLFGYRYLKNDYNDDHGYIFDTNMNGIMLGTRFSF